MPQKKKAVALKYDLEQDLAPVVIASGYGEVAERIINIAEERGIPVYRDDSVASMLCMLEVGASIPEDLYQVVATIYVQIMETANRMKEGVTGSLSASDAGGAGRRSEARIFNTMSAGAIDGSVVGDRDIPGDMGTVGDKIALDAAAQAIRAMAEDVDWDSPRRPAASAGAASARTMVDGIGAFDDGPDSAGGGFREAVFPSAPVGDGIPDSEG